MNRSIISIIFCLAACSFAIAQSKFLELDKFKQIKLLESTREDLEKIFGDDDKDSNGNKAYTENVSIRFHTSSGNCSDEDEEWNVPEGRITEIYVTFHESITPKDLKIDLSKLDRVKRDADEDNNGKEKDNDYVYYDKENSIVFEIFKGEIESMKFIPPEVNSPTLCNNENVRQFGSNKEWFRNKITEIVPSDDRRPIANMADLALSKAEILVDCDASTLTKDNRFPDYTKIAVDAKGESTDPTDVLTYNYVVSGGKIIGSGAQVTWDLTGVKPGDYTITAGVDNGCGICGKTVTKTVFVRTPDCSQK